MNTVLIGQIAQMQPTVSILAFFKSAPLFQILVALMVMDIVSGVFVAIKEKSLNSSISNVGVTRKVFTLLFVAMFIIIQPLCSGLPLGSVVSAFYIGSEILSVIENGANIGVPFPKVLLDTLVKYRGAVASPKSIRNAAHQKDTES